MNKSIETWCDTCGFDKEDLFSQVEVFISELVEIIEGIAKNSKQEIMDGVVDSYWMITLIKHLSEGHVDYTHHFEDLKKHINSLYPTLIDTHFNGFLKAVIESNFSKFCYTDKEVELSVLKYRKLGLEVGVVNNNGVYVLKSKSNQKGLDGKMYPFKKILKGINYFEPNYEIPRG